MCPSSALVGQQARSGLGASYQQEVDLQNLFQDVTEYVGMASVPEQVRHLIDRAVRIAHNKRAVTCVILPNDLQELEYEDPPLAHGATHTGVGYAGPAKLPEESLLRAAADVLNRARKSPCWSGPARSMPPTRSSRSRSGCRPESPRRCSARPRCLTICPSSPARSDCSARSRAGIS